MRKSIRAFAIVSSVVAGFSVAPALYTHVSEASGDTLMGSGMKGKGGMMGEMMEGCNRMMQSMSHDGSERPNERWHKTSPDNNDLPETNG